jgi:hypothetical protein
MSHPGLPLEYWERLFWLAEPRKLMKFTLTYDGDLPSTGNKSKPSIVANIRNAFHDQLEDLWDKHIALRQIARSARVPTIQRWEERSGPRDYSNFKHPDFRGPIPPLEQGQIDLSAPIKGKAASYLPIVRDSLKTICSLSINFMRHEEPGSLFLQGGDIDGRIKTLFDALRMPVEQEEDAADVQATSDPLYCLMENDSLISDFSIKTSRLLGRREKKVHHVILIIDVTINVLQTFPQNQCLLGD